VPNQLIHYLHGNVQITQYIIVQRIVICFENPRKAPIYGCVFDKGIIFLSFKKVYKTFENPKGTLINGCVFDKRITFLHDNRQINGIASFMCLLSQKHRGKLHEYWTTIIPGCYGNHRYCHVRVHKEALK